MTTAAEYNASRKEAIDRLRADGCLPWVDSDPRGSGTFEDWTKHWQRTHGLTPDGRLGPATEAALRQAAEPATITSLEQIATRAETADNTPVDYYLGGGTNRADSAVPWAPMRLKDGTAVKRASDCSNFFCWASGVDKHDRTARNAKGERIWWGTDAIVADATGPHRRWKQIPEPVRGCGVVYAGHRRANGTWSYGHCGIVVAVDKAEVQKQDGATIDCASTPDNDAPNVGDAITRRHGLSVFWRNPGAIFVVPVGVEVP